MMKLALALLLAAVPGSLPKGFNHFYNLEYDAAIHEFERAVEENPEDPAAHNHLAQAVLYREMLRAGALESELVSRSNAFLRRENMQPPAAAVTLFDYHVSRSMELAQARLKTDPKDSEAMYALGVAHGLRANFNFLVRKAWMDSLRDATAARKLHNKVSALEPDNIDARLVEGVHDYVVGSLPWHYKILGFLGGFRGDREEGIRTLELVAQKGENNKYDAQVLLAAVYRREKQPDKALPLLKELIARFPRNYLFRLELALMHQDLGENDKAIAILDRVARLKRSRAAGFDALPVEKIHYYKANVYFWNDQLDEALNELRHVTAAAEDLDLNTGVMAWMRTGQILDLKGERAKAINAYKQAVALAPDSEPGKEAKEYIESRYRRS
jgi:tetratricopeptide (TPR) repeat protein